MRLAHAVRASACLASPLTSSDLAAIWTQATATSCRQMRGTLCGSGGHNGAEEGSGGQG